MENVRREKLYNEHYGFIFYIKQTEDRQKEQLNLYIG